MVNIGGAKIYSILELAEKIIALTNSQSKVIFLPPLEDGDMTRRQPDNSKTEKDFRTRVVDARRRHPKNAGKSRF